MSWSLDRLNRLHWLPWTGEDWRDAGRSGGAQIFVLGCASQWFLSPSFGAADAGCSKTWGGWALSLIWPAILYVPLLKSVVPFSLAARGGRWSSQRGRAAWRGSDNPCQRGAGPWAGAHRGGGAHPEGKDSALLQFGKQVICKMWDSLFKVL